MPTLNQYPRCPTALNGVALLPLEVEFVLPLGAFPWLGQVSENQAPAGEAYSPDQKSKARRSLKNTALSKALTL